MDFCWQSNVSTSRILTKLTSLPFWNWMHRRWGTLDWEFIFVLSGSLPKMYNYLNWSIMCWEPAWGTPPMAKVMRKEALAHAKAGSSLRKPPVAEHLLPKPESPYFTVSCSHLHLWLYGGLFPTSSLGEGVNLQLQSIKIPGQEKCFNLQTPLKVL